MIKIIKDGQKEFIKTCNKCGCEFSYNLDDLYYDQVKCPCCENKVWHYGVTARTLTKNYVAKETLATPKFGTACDNMSVEDYNCTQGNHTRKWIGQAQDNNGRKADQFRCSHCGAFKLAGTILVCMKGDY